MSSVAVAGVASANEKPAVQAPKQKKPDYAAIHARPVPLHVFPLPLLIPHNPLSLLHITYTYLSQVFSASRSHPSTRYKAYFSVVTRSVHVTDEKTVRVLWECGFFGKGNLSRSEPNWLGKEKRRLGMILGETVEEKTRRRREERREFKLDRAMKEREAIEEKLRLERSCTLKVDGGPEAISEDRVANTDLLHQEADAKSTEEATASNGPHPLNTQLAEENLSPTMSGAQGQIPNQETSDDSPKAGTESLDRTIPEIENQEHLQLTLEEAFFLTYGLGLLDIYSQETGQVMPTAALWTIFRLYSCFPPACETRPDDPFLISYVVYHHFRSLGWVVRPGIKFAVDYLLYDRGPVFSHAEFAIVILPSYTHPYWHATASRSTETRKKESKPWWWLQSTNRVLTQVQKSLVVVYVDIPPPETEMEKDKLWHDGKPKKPVLDVGKALKRYRIRELVVKRWMPNRSRD